MCLTPNNHLYTAETTAMTAYLTMPQISIVHRSVLFFRNMLAKEKVSTMFRESGRDMSVGLAYTESGQHFITRTIIPAFSTIEEVDTACVRLHVNLALSYSKVMKRRASWAY